MLYKHINSGALQAAEDPCEITLRYLTGQADFTAFFLAASTGLCLASPDKSGRESCRLGIFWFDKECGGYYNS